MKIELILNSAIALLILVLLTITLYSLVSMKRLKARQKEIAALHKNLAIGQRIMFSGGLIGFVASIQKDFVFVDIGGGVKLEISRYAITEILPN
ncbi:preprotein translocase subunit YajC [Pilibacter termitis]|uniref:Preprotein translocase subunit YajC n=1 Tax=Pilibacter termitis TaxID=263852 RepID=A0A1T4KTY9_9ENTE|nr:preprotein translocase subunit YajC [Pilibacter termitis]SJZ45912.1 preprotein translocase subunit YajC [Pilibacter termitis]